MNKKENKPLHLPMLAAGIAAVLVSGIAIASLAISARGADGIAATGEPSQMAAAPAVGGCVGCGGIASTREIEASNEIATVSGPGRGAAGNRALIQAKPLRNYEIVIRLRDGSTRVVRDANPAKWKRGERVTVIAGVD